MSINTVACSGEQQATVPAEFQGLRPGYVGSRRAAALVWACHLLFVAPAHVYQEDDLGTGCLTSPGHMGAGDLGRPSVLFASLMSNRVLRIGSFSTSAVKAKTKVLASEVQYKVTAICNNQLTEQV